MNLLDLAIVLLIGLGAVNGFRRGAALQLTAYLGLLLGLLTGALVAPPVARLVASPFGQAAIALIVLISMAAVGDAVGWVIGTRFWALARRSAIAAVDSVAGSAVAIVAVLLAAWFLGFNLVNGPFPLLSSEIRGSAIIQGLDRTLPQPPAILAEVRQFLNRFGFPEVFAGLPPAPAGPVKGPTQGQAAAAAEEALASTVRVEGQACGAIQEGSGFVAAPHYVVTNAHVVAGVKDPTVQKQNGGSQTGTVVLFDPRLDLAIIRVSATPGPPLPLDGRDVARGAEGAVLGFPGGGSLKFGPAAVRRQLEATGRDIYGSSVVTREVYELQANVQPGNSGGPFVLLGGKVAGVVFAASTTERRVGYALASPPVLDLLRKALGRTNAVSTHTCTRG